MASKSKCLAFISPPFYITCFAMYNMRILIKHHTTEGLIVCSNSTSLFLNSYTVRFRDQIPRVHIPVHAHGYAFLKRLSKIKRFFRIDSTHTCSELSREVPGLFMHFLKHFSVIFLNKHVNYSIYHSLRIETYR